MRSAFRLHSITPTRRNFWKSRAVPKQVVQPVVDQVKPIIHETLNEVYKPLLDKLSSIDEKLGKIETYIDKYAPKVVKASSGDDVEMVDTKDLKY